MTEPPSGALARFAIGPQLKEYRLQASLTLKDVEEETEISASKLSRIERGASSIRLSDLGDLCKLYGITDEGTVLDLQGLAKATKLPSSFRSYADVVSPNFRRYIDLEEQAATFSWYEVANVPGLLQTPDFARAIMATASRAGFELDDDKLERRLQVRRKRQKILDRDAPPALNVVLNKAVLDLEYGAPHALAGQLEYFLDTMERPNVDIRVMPPDRVHAGLATGPFIILDFPEEATTQLPASVYIDGHLGFNLTDRKEEVDLFRTAWDDMWHAAPSTQESADIIGGCLRELRRRR
ncbi:helix-turn-helix domain-containing protein [Kribbella sp. NPDC059898]|uniref:helix-turn-helix domain-containing protein n=1 Tax=Kribbella sp. NPDC059898 TaxID=3346995 RepID=UPI00364A1DA4